MESKKKTKCGPKMSDIKFVQSGCMAETLHSRENLENNSFISTSSQTLKTLTQKTKKNYQVPGWFEKYSFQKTCKLPYDPAQYCNKECL